MIERPNQEGLDNETLPELQNSTILDKLKTRVEQGKPADVVCLDFDGVVYELNRTADGRFERSGDNTELSKIMAEGSIPHLIISARPDWGEGDSAKAAEFGLSDPDAVIVGVGTVIYWRDKEGKLIADQEYSELMKHQKISFVEDGKPKTIDYSPEVLADVLSGALNDYAALGCDKIKIDRNSQGGFVVLDISDMPYDVLTRLIREIKHEVNGVRVTFSENIEKVSDEVFTGWLQVLPKGAGKDGATRFALDKIARGSNPAQIDQKKVKAHIFGDSAVDIWMLALGNRQGDPYTMDQYLLKNATPHAQNKTRPLLDACSGETDDADITRITELQEAGRLQQYRSALIEEMRGIDQTDSANRDRIRAIRLELHKITRVSHPEYPSANLRMVEESGPTGVLAIAKNL